jgi:hypothetical protein
LPTSRPSSPGRNRESLGTTWSFPRRGDPSQGSPRQQPYRITAALAFLPSSLGSSALARRSEPPHRLRTPWRASCGSGSPLPETPSRAVRRGATGFKALLHCRVRCRHRAVAGVMRSLLPWASLPFEVLRAPLPSPPRGDGKRVAASCAVPPGAIPPGTTHRASLLQFAASPRGAVPCCRSLSGAGVAASRRPPWGS